MFEFRGYINGDTIYVEIRYNGEVIDTKQFASYFTSFVDGVEYKGTEGAIKSIQFEIKMYKGYYANNIFYKNESNNNETTTNTTTITETYTNTIISETNTKSGNTIKLGTEELTTTIDSMKDNITKLQGIGIPGIKDITKKLWDEVIKPKLLSERQIAKKVLLITNPTMTEEEAHLQVYGKLYYVNNSLDYNDYDYPDSISKITDDFFYQPLTETHPLWIKIKNWIKELKNSIIQLGIKLGEFINLIADITVTISLAITSLFSSIIILPFGAGMPTALTAVKTVMSEIKKLQAKVSEFFPLLSAFDIIGLLLPITLISGIVATLIGIFKGINTLIESLVSILGFLSILEALFKRFKKKFDSIKLTVTAKATPSTVNINQQSILSAEASGGDYNYKFEWTDKYGNIIENNSTLQEEDDGTRLLTPYIPRSASYSIIPQRDISKYTVKLTDGKGNVATSTVEISRV